MPTPTPAPAPAPEPEPGGFLGKIRAWFEKDVEPDIVAAKADIESLKSLAPALMQLASTVEALVKSADPEAAPAVAALVTDAEKAVAVIGQVVAELGASGV